MRHDFSSLAEPVPFFVMRARFQSECGRAAFTLIELLVVISIIAVLATLGFAATSGALKSARKAETRAMANQIKLAISSYYTEYGIYPTNTLANTEFLNLMTGATTNNNRRQIRFLEVPSKYTNGSGIVTPAGLYKDRAERRTFNIATDTNYDGIVQFNPGSGATNMPGSAAVWVGDPDRPTNAIGSW